MKSRVRESQSRNKPRFNNSKQWEGYDGSALYFTLFIEKNIYISIFIICFALKCIAKEWRWKLVYSRNQLALFRSLVMKKLQIRSINYIFVPGESFFFAGMFLLISLNTYNVYFYNRVLMNQIFLMLLVTQLIESLSLELKCRIDRTEFFHHATKEVINLSKMNIR